MHARILQSHDDVLLKLMTDKLLSDLVMHKEKSYHRLKEELATLRLRSHFTSPAIAVMQQVEASPESRAMRDRTEPLRDFLQDEVAERAIVFIDENGWIVLIFSWPSNGWIEELAMRIRRDFAMDVNIGVGMPYNQLAQVHHSYQQAVTSLQHIFYTGKGNVVYADSSRVYRRFGTYPSHKEKELYEKIKSTENPDLIRKGVEHFYDHLLDDGPIEIDEVREITFRLIIGMERKILSMMNEDRALTKMDIMTVAQLETLQEIIEFVYQTCLNLRKLITDKSENHHFNIIEKSIHVMEQDCEHASLNYVAQKVFMTPTYLSLLFKTKTGKTFIDMLTDIRIQKAKQMLRDTHLRNYEVAEKIGYQDPRYFSQIFKKRVGLSPSEFREFAGKS